VTDAQQTFNPRLVVGMIFAGIVAFAALLLLLAYGGSIGREPTGRAHVQSIAATGYKGLVQLVGEFHEANIVEGAEAHYTEDLVVVALEQQTRREMLTQLLERRQGRATLLILPKWWTIRDPIRRGWVRAAGSGTGGMAVGLLQGKVAIQSYRGRPPRTAIGENILDGLRVPVPREPQLVTGGDLTTLVGLPGGGALVAKLGDQPHYLVADPDLLNNHGLSDPAVARAALQLIEGLNATGAESVNFDVTEEPIGGGRDRPNILRVAFEPPFLAMTLALAFAALMAALHGAFRFGPARREERSIAFGKAALVENGAGLIRLAGREARLGGAYADVVRQDTARATGASQWLRDGDLDAYLNRLGKPDRPGFSELAAQLLLARDRQSLVAAARALFQWKKEIIR
jgi:hypothetical protein